MIQIVTDILFNFDEQKLNILYGFYTCSIIIENVTLHSVKQMSYKNKNADWFCGIKIKIHWI